MQEDLLAIVARQTNLPLRVVSDRPGAQNEQGRLSFRSQISLIGIGFGLFLAAFPLGAGILALIAPLTNSFALNLCVAIVYGGAGLAMLGLIAKGIIDIYRSRIPDPVPPFVVLPFVPAAAIPDAGISIRFGERLRDRLIALVLLIAGLMSNGYLAMRAVGDFSIGDLSQGTLTDPHKLGLGLFGTCALISIVFPCMAVFSHSTFLSVDEDGLHQGKGKKQESIAWRDVATLTTRVSRPNTLESFEVLEEPPHSTKISWPADARWVRLLEGIPAGDAGAQFAAIVAQRAGVQPVTRWE